MALYEIQETFKTQMPYEIGLQLAITLISALHGNYIIFFINLPMTLYNFYLFFAEKSPMKHNIIIGYDYMFSNQKEKIIKIKLIFYIIENLTLAFRFAFAFSNMMMYHLGADG